MALRPPTLGHTTGRWLVVFCGLAGLAVFYPVFAFANWLGWGLFTVLLIAIAVAVICCYRKRR